MSVPRSVEFSEENTLPGSQLKTAVFDDQGLGVAEYHCLDMGRRVALQVTVPAVLGYYFLEMLLDVGNHAGIGVLVDGYSGSGMGHKNEANPAVHSAVGYYLVNPGCNILEFNGSVCFYVN